MNTGRALVVLADIYIAIVAVQTLVGAPWLFTSYNPGPDVVMALVVFFVGAPLATAVIGGTTAAIAMLAERKQAF